MRLEVIDSMDWSYPDSQVSDRPRRTVQLESARGARPGFQLLLADVPEGAPVRVSIGPLKCKGGGLLREAESFHLLSVPVEENTGLHGFTNEADKNEFVTRRAPFRVYDVVRPMPGESPALAGTNSFLVQFHVGPSARPGTYSGTVTLSAGSESATIAVSLRVHRATIPAKGHLKVTNWFSLDNMATHHGLKPWSPAHWTMIRKYAELMRRNRQNMFWVPLGYIAARKGKDGRWRFDFARWERTIRTFLSAGLTWIEGGHLAGRKEWDSPRYNVTGQGEMLATDPEGFAYLGALLTEIRKLVERNGWKARYVQHLADEPHGADVPDYRVLAAIARKFLPGVPLIDAIQNTGLGGALDIWVPLNSQYEQQREGWELHRSFGDEIWHYTCCVPGGRYLNRLLDQSLLRPRLLHWGNYFYDLDGFLHWGLNHGRQPFEMSVVGHGGNNKLPAGDTHTVYPGTDGPWSSMRFEAMREGLEDYELLLQVAEKDRKLADRITRQVFRGFADYTEDVGVFRKAHARLLRAASEV